MSKWKGTSSLCDPPNHVLCPRTLGTKEGINPQQLNTFSEVSYPPETTYRIFDTQKWQTLCGNTTFSLRCEISLCPFPIANKIIRLNELHTTWHKVVTRPPMFWRRLTGNIETERKKKPITLGARLKFTVSLSDQHAQLLSSDTVVAKMANKRTHLFSQVCVPCMLHLL